MPLRTLWGGLTVALGLVQLVLLRAPWRRHLFLASTLACFVWMWVALAFLLSNGYVTTAQAAYVPAAVASAWIAFRTAPIRS